MAPPARSSSRIRTRGAERRRGRGQGQGQEGTASGQQDQEDTRHPRVARQGTATSTSRSRQGTATSTSRSRSRHRHRHTTHSSDQHTALPRSESPPPQETPTPARRGPRSAPSLPPSDAASSAWSTHSTASLQDAADRQLLDEFLHAAQLSSRGGSVSSSSTGTSATSTTDSESEAAFSTHQRLDRARRRFFDIGRAILLAVLLLVQNADAILQRLGRGRRRFYGIGLGRAILLAVLQLVPNVGPPAHLGAPCALFPDLNPIFRYLPCDPSTTDCDFISPTHHPRNDFIRLRKHVTELRRDTTGPIYFDLARSDTLRSFYEAAQTEAEATADTEAGQDLLRRITRLLSRVVFKLGEQTAKTHDLFCTSAEYLLAKVDPIVSAHADAVEKAEWVADQILTRLHEIQSEVEQLAFRHRQVPQSDAILPIDVLYPLRIQTADLLISRVALYGWVAGQDFTDKAIEAWRQNLTFLVANAASFSAGELLESMKIIEAQFRSFVLGRSNGRRSAEQDAVWRFSYTTWAYCIPRTHAILKHSTDGEHVHPSDGHDDDEDDEDDGEDDEDDGDDHDNHCITDHDPSGQACHAHDNVIHWWWHNAVPMQSNSSPADSIHHYTHWTTLLGHRNRRNQNQNQKGARTIPLNAWAADGKPAALVPEMGMIRLGERGKKRRIADGGHRQV